MAFVFYSVPFMLTWRGIRAALQVFDIPQDDFFRVPAIDDSRDGLRHVQRVQDLIKKLIPRGDDGIITHTKSAP